MATRCRARAKRRRLANPHTRSPALFIGLFLGLAAGLGLWFWGQSLEVAVAAFFIAGYTSGLWFHLNDSARRHRDHYRTLCQSEVNRPARRARRLLRDWAFWWTLLFGITVIGGAAWFSGLREPTTLVWIVLSWTVVTIVLNYEVTILEPTTRCRSCGYQLIGVLDPSNPTQVVRCSECGTQWSKEDLCLGLGAG